MARKMMDLVPVDLLELAGLLRPAWDEISAGIPAWHPRNEDGGEGEAGGEGGEGEGGGGEGSAGGEGEGEKDAEHYRKQLREFERNAKRGSTASQKRIAELEAKLKEREEADQSDHEKAIAKAREEAKAEAQAEVNLERRHDRLEVQATRLASTGITVKVTEDGEEKDKVLKFADPDDALIYVDRAIKAGDVDEDDIFDSEGKVQTDALRTALQDILERKPHLQASGGTANGAARVSGSADGGKGSGAGKDEESLSVEERFERLQKTKK